jgi:hypothetical protein
MGERHQVREHHSGLVRGDPYSSRSCKERALCRQWRAREADDFGNEPIVGRQFPVTLLCRTRYQPLVDLSLS